MIKAQMLKRILRFISSKLEIVQPKTRIHEEIKEIVKLREHAEIERLTQLEGRRALTCGEERYLLHLLGKRAIAVSASEQKRYFNFAQEEYSKALKELELA